MASSANIGVIGLGAMGRNFARNLAQHGNTVAVFNRHAEVTEQFIENYGYEGDFIPGWSLEEFVSSLAQPRTVVLLIKAGQPTDSVMKSLVDLLSPEDIIVDAGNALFKDTIRREQEMRGYGIHFVGCGISGGEEGALKGPSLMPGGSQESWSILKPILESVAARVDGEACVTHIGTDGAGHFVKMVHNGIEYADMQAIGEVYDVMRRGLGLAPERIADVFESWNDGELSSYLLEISADILRERDSISAIPLIDCILDRAGMKGTGTWTVQTALENNTTVSSIAEAVFARSLSSQTELRSQASLQAAASKNRRISGVSQQECIESLKGALLVSKVIAYAQGFSCIQDGATIYGWDIDLAEVARIWKGGCIIRARYFLDSMVTAFHANPELKSLLFDSYFSQIIAHSEQSWRSVIALCSLSGIPVPMLSSSLAYFDGLYSDRLPAALIQAQRDYFGAHTYRRVDREGVFHTLWNEDGRPEVQAENA